MNRRIDDLGYVIAFTVLLAVGVTLTLVDILMMFSYNEVASSVTRDVMSMNIIYTIGCFAYGSYITHTMK